MKLRHALAFVILPIVLVLAILQGGTLLTRSYMDEASLQANSALRLAVAALAGHLGRYEPLPALIADHDDIEGLLQAPENPALRKVANNYLKEINSLLGSSDIYVMTPDGNTVAASNYDKPGTFVGENFSYRPYFQDAVAGRPARFYALGTTSLKRGYYFSSPVEVAGKILGVIVFKVDIDSIESSWRGGEYKIFVADPEGIIFMTGAPEWLYTGILPLDGPRLARTQASRRYAEAQLRPLSVTESVYHGQHLLRIAGDGTSREYLRLSHYMPDADWTVNVLLDTASVRAQARTTLIAVLLFICLAAAAAAVIWQRRARVVERLRLQEEARNELEHRVEERTADLARVNEQIELEIAERRLTEQELRKTQADLIQAGKLAGLGQMSAALSHEFNQPLAAAKTYADSAGLLIERGRVPEAQDNVRRISALIDRMASISRHLRNFARKPNERLGSVRLSDAIADTMEIVAPRLKAADARLVVELENPDLAVLAGPVRLQQVLVNIISNAADAVEGLAERDIVLTACRRDGRIGIEVRDRGPGVPGAITERIFDPFFTTKGVGKGLGLGLSISYNIVKDFGGSLTVFDHPEGGAVFQIVLEDARTVQEAAE
ncbi:sensor histidine kinase [Shinella zoogloeoides]|uniref:C4-dicarboxylate transport sensor protein n=1 Tax=Shinella zoogloeoides TaxID=352475 RepID=A0A6N8TH55_SHIZO|nr:sensor histidine kinase [Shinella zoogloeoides]MXO00470.1 two-component sensor histidine kinase [Shinella zoogloeoides]UEX83935.1 sensor histidine kinase [Shinella zoogloeoides]